MTPHDSPWQIHAFDPARYLELLGVEPGPPSLDLLERIHHAHGHAFSFTNIDVLLGRHPGVEPATVARRMLQEGLGGYCYEHAQLMAAVLEQLGFTVHRRLGRVHSHASTRTHMSLDVELEGRLWFLDPGFGLSITGPLEREDGAQREEWFGTMSLHRLETADGSAEAWELRRGEDLQHITDLFEVVPADVRAAHHVTSTMPGGGPMRTNLIFGRYVEGGHVMITRDARTVRRDGEPTEHEEITLGQAFEAIAELGYPLDRDTVWELEQVLDSTG